MLQIPALQDTPRHPKGSQTQTARPGPWARALGPGLGPGPLCPGLWARACGAEPVAPDHIFLIQKVVCLCVSVCMCVCVCVCLTLKEFVKRVILLGKQSIHIT